MKGNYLKKREIIAYVRVSSQGQVADGVSLERQEAEVRQYCLDNHLEEPVIIADRGLSGYKESRPGYQRILGMARDNTIAVLIVWDLARLSRSLRTIIEFFDDVVGTYGFRFVALKNSVDTSTPWGKAWLAILASINQLYRDEISYRTKASLHYKRQRYHKLGGHAPYGFDADEAGNLISNSAEQAHIRELIAWRAAGLSYQAICTKLATLGIPTKTGNTHWHPKVVRALVIRSGDIQKSGPLPLAREGDALSNER